MSLITFCMILCVKIFEYNNLRCSRMSIVHGNFVVVHIYGHVVKRLSLTNNEKQLTKQTNFPKLNNSKQFQYQNK